MKKHSNDEKIKKRKIHINSFGIFVLTIIVCAAIVAGYFSPKISKQIEVLGGGRKGLIALLLGQTEETRKNLSKINIIIIGESGVDETKQSDTLMIVSYDPKAQKAAILSIPRDTYVGKANTANAIYKINARYVNGERMNVLISDLENITGLDLNYYIRIDTNALTKLVDSIGGVEFDVPIKMDYDDDGQKLHIHLNKGVQIIDGAKAEQLLRFRHNNNGSTYPFEYGQEDFGRMKTQRAFMTAILQKVIATKNISKLSDAISKGFGSINTNIENMDVLKDYIPDLLDFQIENLKTDVLPGQAVQRDGLWIFEYDKNKTKKVVQELFLDGEEIQATSTPNAKTTGTAKK